MHVDGSALELRLFTQKCRRFLRVPEPPRISRKEQRCSKCLRKDKNGEMLLQVHMVWVTFLSFPNNCFMPSSCSISGKVQTTSEGSSRHPVLAKEVLPRHPSLSNQTQHLSFPTGATVWWPLQTKYQTWYSAEHATNKLDSKEPFAEAPGSHPIRYFIGTTNCFCCSGCCSLASIPHWLQGNVGFLKALQTPRAVCCPSACLNHSKAQGRPCLGLECPC